MWLSEKTIGKTEKKENICSAGVISIGGAMPSAVADGEQRETVLLGGAAIIPNVGDEVLVIRDCEGKSYILGMPCKSFPENAVRGELILSAGNGALLRVKPDGKIELSGEISLKGTTRIDGVLLINGMPYVPAALTSGGELGGA